MPESSVPAVRIQDVSVSYGSVPALTHCSLEVTKGELLCVVGPSGCGKSTLLKAVAGFVRPNNGTVEVNGRNVAGLPVKDRQLAYIMDRLGLYPHLNVFENIAYPLRVRKVSSREITTKVSETLRLTGILGLEKRRPDELSAGQKQRVAVARALVRDDAVILLADESFSSLDAQLRYQLRTEFRSWQRARKLACIFVTHDQEEALSLGDRVALMNLGAIEQIGTPADVYDKPATIVSARFFGRPPCNLVPFAHSNGRPTAVGELYLRAFSQPKAVPASQLILGFRPEAVEIRPAVDGVSVAKVDWVEPLNPDSVVHLVWDGFKLTVRLRRSSGAPLTGPVAISVPDDRWLMFDQATGKRISA